MWLMLIVAALLVGVFAMGAYLGPIIGDRLEARRLRRSRSQRVAMIEQKTLARMRQGIRDEAARERAKRGRK